MYLPAENSIDFYKEELSKLQDLYYYYSRYGHVVIGGDFNASCLEADRRYSNSYKSRELLNFVERNNLYHPYLRDNVPINRYSFITNQTMLDYIFTNTYMGMLLRSYEILKEGSTCISSTSDHLRVTAIFDVYSKQHILQYPCVAYCDR